MPTRIHPHKLKRVNTAKKGLPSFYVYKCAGCSFFLQEKLCLGHDAECWRCQKTFVMEQHNLRQTRPRCRECTGKSIPLGEMPPPRIDLERIRQNVPPETEKITEEQADKMVDRILGAVIQKGKR